MINLNFDVEKESEENQTDIQDEANALVRFCSPTEKKIVLARFDGKRWKDISRMCGCSVTKVIDTFFRAMKRLRKKASQEKEENPARPQ